VRPIFVPSLLEVRKALDTLTVLVFNSCSVCLLVTTTDKGRAIDSLEFSLSKQGRDVLVDSGPVVISSFREVLKVEECLMGFRRF